jgi:sugar/nucleoside kinase (ribokinase family)
VSLELSAVVAGHICLDIIPQFDTLLPGEFASLFQPGRLIEVGPAVLSTGGAASNTGLALHKLGVPTRLMGKVGDDLFGKAVLDIIRSHGQGLEMGMVVDKNTSTSYSVIINPPGFDRLFLNNPGANETFSVADIRYDLVAQAALFHFGYPTVMRRMFENNGLGLTQLFKQAKATGVTTSLDLTFPDPASAGGRADWPAIFQAVLAEVDIFTPSIEELLFLLRRETYSRLLQAAGNRSILELVTAELLSDVSDELLGLGVKIIMLKLGERGVYLRTASQPLLQRMGRASPVDYSAWADQELWAPSFQVDVVGTTGSGDAAIAGFFSGLLRGMSPKDALTAASAVGACNVEAADALSGIRSWEATLARVANGWQQHPLQLPNHDWRWDDEHQLWKKPHQG